MEDMQSQMNAILGNPEMMQKIMAMAQSLGAAPANEEPQEQDSGFSLPDIDPGMLQKLSGLAGSAGIDKDQRTLLKALTPYLSRERILKLEKAMRAAKMAKMASSFLGQTGLLNPGGK